MKKPDYSHLGQPAGLTFRASAEWIRQNTYYIGPYEAIVPDVLADVPDCFDPLQWERYVEALASGGWRLAGSPNSIQHETASERVSRQKRSARTAACEDCSLPYQLEQRRLGRCQPPPHATTPVDRMIEAENTEVPDARPTMELQSEARLPDREGR